MTRDPVAGLFHRRLDAGVLLTANCEVNLWNDACQRFDMNRSRYAHFFKQAVIPPGGWDKVIGELRDASSGSLGYDPKHAEWNFGFNLMSLQQHRAINFTAMYERLASRVLSRRMIRGDSLICARLARSKRR